MATKDKIVNLEDLKVLSDHVEGEVTDLKSDISLLGENGEIAIHGNIHNYYFGGSSDYKTVTPSSIVRTAVFPLEDGKKYHIVITGNHSNIGYANEEYETTGDLSNNTANNPYDLYITNTNNFKYLYVFYYNSNHTPVDNPHVDVFADTELVTKADLEESVSNLKSAITQSVSRLNWYDPNDNYRVVASDGEASRTGAVINQDGSITYTVSNEYSGQVQFRSTDDNKVLKAGTYTLSARVTYNENVTGTERRVFLRLGLSNANRPVQPTTERDNSTTIGTGLTGWVRATFVISQDDVFTFEILPWASATCSASLPFIVDYVQINEGSTVMEYTPNTITAEDKIARKEIVELNESVSTLVIKAEDIFNAEPYTGDYDWQTPTVEYGALFKGKNHVESFAFFTDPHVLGFGDSNRNETKMHNYLKRVQTAYNQTPCSYIVSCGDWLNNSTTMDEACYRFGQLKGIAEHMFGGLKIVLGNHDTNYQGKATPESENWTGRLTDETIAAIMYRDSETKKAYFSFEGDYATCYVLDSGTDDGHSSMLAYDWEQLAWLAEKLSQDDPEHAIIFLHIIVSGDTVLTFAATFGQLVEAYNAHTTITLNNQLYDFTSCSGRVDLWVAGHTHQDSNGLLGGVPYVISTTNAYTSDVPIIDLALIDYDNNMLYLKRVGGKGTDRTISLTTGQLITE